MKTFLEPWLSSFQWFRRWYGGKWSRWEIDLPLTNRLVWVPQWERPGCGALCLARECYEIDTATVAEPKR